MIYKTAHGELWCDCGNTVETQGFLPVDANGNSLAYDQITGGETRYTCNACRAIASLDKMQLRERTGWVIEESSMLTRIEVRQAYRHFLACCRHVIRPDGKFVAIGYARRPYCVKCGLRLVEEECR